MALEFAAGQISQWMTETFGTHGTTAVELLEIMGINILLSGDNAVVIALACRSLPPAKRRMGIILGVLAAIGLRIAFTLGLQQIMAWPWLMLTGGLLLLWIAVQLLLEADDHDKVIADSKTLMGAMWTIALADVVMSLDNVLAIAGAAHGQQWLIVVGLAMSIPLIVGGATLIINILTRYPILVWAGAALLGWIAGELIGAEKNLAVFYDQIIAALGIPAPIWPNVCAAIGALIVILIGGIAMATRGGRRTRHKA